MIEKPELYFPRDVEWREWLALNHAMTPEGVYLVFYKLETGIPTMRWEEAVRVALCYGWIDSTVKSLGGGKRRQYFCPRKPKSGWSALNKQHIIELEAAGLIHDSGYQAIELAKQNGSWSILDAIEAGIIPEELTQALKQQPEAYQNFQNFAPGYRKSYLRWLYEAKRDATRIKRIQLIVQYAGENRKMRP